MNGTHEPPTSTQALKHDKTDVEKGLWDHVDTIWEEHGGMLLLHCLRRIRIDFTVA